MPVNTTNFDIPKPTISDAYRESIVGFAFDRIDRLCTGSVHTPSATQPSSPVAGQLYGVVGSGWTDPLALPFSLAYRTFGGSWEYWVPDTLSVWFDLLAPGTVWVLNPGVSWTSFALGSVSNSVTSTGLRYNWAAINTAPATGEATLNASPYSAATTLRLRKTDSEGANVAPILAAIPGLTLFQIQSGANEDRYAWVRATVNTNTTNDATFTISFLAQSGGNFAVGEPVTISWFPDVDNSGSGSGLTESDVRSAIDTSLDIETIKTASQAIVTQLEFADLLSDAGIGTPIVWTPASFTTSAVQTGVTIAANALRKGVRIMNDTGVPIYIRLGASNPTSSPGTYDHLLYDKQDLVLFGVDAVGEVRLISGGVPVRALGYTLGL